MNYKGQIANFPPEVVEWMLDQQVKQGNKRDVSVFENINIAGRSFNGFEWKNTNEGYEFCYSVIVFENFDLFFQRYPKKTSITKAITDIEAMRETHVKWAARQKELTDSGQPEVELVWSYQHHVDIIEKYDNVLRILKSL